jgi:hypothetical protein
MSDQTNLESRPRARWCAMALLFVAPLAIGCASRAAPFNELGDAQLTILRLQAQTAATTTPTAQPGAMIPGLPAEWQQMGQQLLQNLQQTLPPGLIPPGLIPGQPATTAQPQVQMYKGQWAITAQQPVQDTAMRDDLLDLFGDKDSFQPDRGNCFTPGFAAIFTTPKRAEPVEVVISFSCNQAVMYGAPWPHPAAGFTPETQQKLVSVYQRLFGPVPSGA